MPRNSYSRDSLTRHTSRSSRRRRSESRGTESSVRISVDTINKLLSSQSRSHSSLNSKPRCHQCGTSSSDKPDLARLFSKVCKVESLLLAYHRDQLNAIYSNADRLKSLKVSGEHLREMLQNTMCNTHNDVCTSTQQSVHTSISKTDEGSENQ